MREFSEQDIENYIKYIDENVIDFEEIEGHCFQCGKLLNEVPVPQGPEGKVVCLLNRPEFTKEFEEIEASDFK